jgi:hypothetical protein
MLFNRMMLHTGAPITGTNMHQNMHQATQRTCRWQGQGSRLSYDSPSLIDDECEHLAARMAIGEGQLAMFFGPRAFKEFWEGGLQLHWRV